jgi:hypothetical protein
MALGRNTRTFKVSTGSKPFSAVLDDLGEEIFAATRVGAQAGADVVYQQVQQNVRAIGSKTGNLGRSIYQAFSPESSVVHGSRGGKETYSKAVYSVSWRTSLGEGGPGSRAPHGGLVEYGHLQRYASYINKKGEWKTAIRPEMQGKPPPKRRAPQAVKDAYYVLLQTPKQVAAKPFIRTAVSAFDRAEKAMVDAFFSDLVSKGIVK